MHWFVPRAASIFLPASERFAKIDTTLGAA